MDTTILVRGRRFRLSSHGERIDGALAALVDHELESPAQLAAVRRLLAGLGYESLGDDLEVRGRLRELFESGRVRILEDDVHAGATPGVQKKDEAGAAGGPAVAPAVAPTSPSFLDVLRTRIRSLVAREKPVEAPPPAPAPAVTPQKYKLVELVEVVDRGGLGTVVGAAKESSLLPKHFERTEQQGSAYKQFINLAKDIEGAAKRHAEHGRYIDLRARIEWTEGDKTNSLAGKNVKWKATIKRHTGSGRPASLAVITEQAGMWGSNDTMEVPSPTDAAGWASMRFYLSQYAGDEFNITAELDTSDANAVGGPSIKAGPYVVWRKFWYQLSHRDGATVPAPARSVTAWDKVGAALVAADVVKFSKTSTPAPPDRTFYPTGMTITGSSDATEIALIGSENKEWFFTKLLKNDVSQPVKGHLVICDGQWDYKDDSPLQRFEMKAKAQDLTIDLNGVANAGILKPALRGNIVLNGGWYVDPDVVLQYLSGSPPANPPAPSKYSGGISDAEISISLPRTGKNIITVTLPADAPDPTKYKIWVNLKVGYGKHYAGESSGPRMLIKLNPTDLNDYNDTVSHEFGHGFRMTPKKPDKRNTVSLPAHAKQYDETDGHGGSGPHCSTDTTVGAVSTSAPNGRYDDGTCIMYHAGSSTVSGSFCSTCEPHLRLQPFDSLYQPP